MAAAPRRSAQVLEYLAAARAGARMFSGNGVQMISGAQGPCVSMCEYIRGRRSDDAGIFTGAAHSMNN